MKPSRDRHRQALQLQILTLGHAIAVYFGTSIGRIIGFSNLGSSPVATIFVRMEFAVSLTSPRVAANALKRLISTKRSEERRVGKECVSTCESRVSRYH